jgi:hypothetical protein
MAAGTSAPGPHERVDQLNPAQADAVRAVVVQFVNPATTDAEPLPRRLSFAGTWSAEQDLAERSEEIIDETACRNAR